MLSVIIPCHDNHHTLPWILCALRKSGLANLEILCVDDASERSISAITEQYGARLIRIDGTPGRRALARNRGHEEATNRLTLYIDGDVIPDPDLPATALKLHKVHARVAIKYPVYGIPQQLNSESLVQIASLILQRERNQVGKLVTKPISIDTRPLPNRLRGRRTRIWQLCASHCLSVERQDVELAGGWDTSFLGWGEEDLELAYRLHCLGVEFIYPHRRAVTAYHVDHPINWESNLATLRSNLRYFERKFPDAYRSRLSLLRYYLRELQISENRLVAE